jgi:hypothetical protein
MKKSNDWMESDPDWIREKQEAEKNHLTIHLDFFLMK